MIENTKFTNTQDLIKCCNDSIDFLFDLNYQLEQLIAAKTKLYAKTNAEMNSNRCQEIMDSKNNLEKIMTTLSPAISHINQIVQQIPKLTQSKNIE